MRARTHIPLISDINHISGTRTHIHAQHTRAHANRAVYTTYLQTPLCKSQKNTPQSNFLTEKFAYVKKL